MARSKQNPPAACLTSISSSLQLTKPVHDASLLVAYPDRYSHFITRIIFIGFSSIIRQREILPAECFTKRHISKTLKYPCLTSIHPKTESLIKMLFDAGEFVKLGLLKEIALVITKKENEEEAIEVHSFKFQCLENGDISTTLNTVAGKSPSQRKHQPVLTPSTSKSREHQIVHLIKSVRNLCASLRPLPKKCAANFRVNYTDLAENNDRIEGFHTTETFYELAKKAVTVEVEKSNQDEQEAVLSCSSVFVKPKFGTSSRFNPSSRESSSASMNSTQKNSSNNKSRNIEKETVQLLKELLDENNWSYPANLKQSEESL
ncbi:hypothetical protein L5515_015088 [Caenorhabditis briggsae]|uniref:HORMA domain-containing protein n=1 Tax=Caenorhabditis briggsae TaxID=6238 RepID=A0AAE9EAW5_CAEBR|nr:hypothetical protein L5515_015088 [Caenorhabditis briggsae]